MILSKYQSSVKKIWRNPDDANTFCRMAFHTLLTLFRTFTKSEASLSNKGAKYVFKVLLREASFARAIRISTLPTRLSSLASGVSMFDVMITDFVAFGHGNWKSLDAQKMMVEERILYWPPSHMAYCRLMLLARLLLLK